MNKKDKKERYFELRINGETFHIIAIKLEVSKQILINWSKKDKTKEAIH
jgi:hypothetical protein